MNKPIIKWVGGKNQIMDELIKYFPKEMNNYHEIMIGGGSVIIRMCYLKKNKEIKVNKIYGYDINEDLINLYDNIKNNPKELYKRIIKLKERYNKIEIKNGNQKPKNKKEGLESKESFYYYCRNKYNNSEMDKIKKSAYFVFLNKTCFRGLYRIGKNGFNVPYGNYENPEIINLEHLLEISELIKEVEFKKLSYVDSFTLIKSNDFAYLDPPYLPINKTSFTSYMKEEFDHINFFNELKKLNCKWILSNSFHPTLKEIFSNYKIIDIDVKRNINSKKPNSKTKEYLIINIDSNEFLGNF